MVKHGVTCKNAEKTFDVGHLKIQDLKIQKPKNKSKDEKKIKEI